MPNLIVVEKSTQKTNLTIATMPVGSFGILDSTGQLYFRTRDTAACLSNPGHTYTNADACLREVTLLPIGTTITIEIGADGRLEVR